MCHFETNQDIKKLPGQSDIKSSKMPLKQFNSKENVKEIYTHPFEDLSPVLTYFNSSIKPPGAYLISDLLERGLMERGAYSQNQVVRTYLVASQFFYPILYCGINIQFYGSTT